MNRKELMEAYKNRKVRTGVFQIRNLQTGKILVEESVDLDKIWNRHRTQLHFGGHPNAELQRDWKTYGEPAFVYEILAELDPPEDQQPQDLKRELQTLRQMYLEELQPFGEKGYNKRSSR